MDLATTYLGMKLRSPLVPAASPLSAEVDDIRRMEDAGAGAVVLYSLFEEQIRFEGKDSPPYFPVPREFRASPDAYLKHIADAKQAVRIPVIASLNGSTLGGWIDYATQIQRAGADALELNMYCVPTDMELPGAQVEQDCIDILKAVKSKVTIPVAVKLSPFFSNFANMAKRFDEAGAGALVIFNRFYQPEIDLDKMAVTPSLMLSTLMDMRLPLRWVAILHGRIRANLAATSGIHRATDAIKMLMAGADVAMLCSVLLRYGIKHLSAMEREIVTWMERQHYESVGQFRGCLSHANCPDPSAFERAHYIHSLSTYAPLFLQESSR